MANKEQTSLVNVDAGVINLEKAVYLASVYQLLAMSCLRAMSSALPFLSPPPAPPPPPPAPPPLLLLQQCWLAAGGLLLANTRNRSWPGMGVARANTWMFHTEVCSAGSALSDSNTNTLWIVWRFSYWRQAVYVHPCIAWRAGGG